MADAVDISGYVCFGVGLLLAVIALVIIFHYITRRKRLKKMLPDNKRLVDVLKTYKAQQQGFTKIQEKKKSSPSDKSTRSGLTQADHSYYLQRYHSARATGNTARPIVEKRHGADANGIDRSTRAAGDVQEQQQKQQSRRTQAVHASTNRSREVQQTSSAATYKYGYEEARKLETARAAAATRTTQDTTRSRRRHYFTGDENHMIYYRQGYRTTTRHHGAPSPDTRRSHRILMAYGTVPRDREVYRHHQHHSRHRQHQHHHVSHRDHLVYGETTRGEQHRDQQLQIHQGRRRQERQHQHDTRRRYYGGDVIVYQVPPSPRATKHHRTSPSAERKSMSMSRAQEWQQQRRQMHNVSQWVRQHSIDNLTTSQSARRGAAASRDYVYSSGTAGRQQHQAYHDTSLARSHAHTAPLPDVYLYPQDTSLEQQRQLQLQRQPRVGPLAPSIDSVHNDEFGAILSLDKRSRESQEVAIFVRGTPPSQRSSDTPYVIASQSLPRHLHLQPFDGSAMHF